jgi:hypothetical protein
MEKPNKFSEGILKDKKKYHSNCKKKKEWGQSIIKKNGTTNTPFCSP